MLAKAQCPICKKEFYISICIECLEDLTFLTLEDAHKYIIDNVTVRLPESHECEQNNWDRQQELQNEINKLRND